MKLTMSKELFEQYLKTGTVLVDLISDTIGDQYPQVVESLKDISNQVNSKAPDELIQAMVDIYATNDIKGMSIAYDGAEITITADDKYILIMMDMVVKSTGIIARIYKKYHTVFKLATTSICTMIKKFKKEVVDELNTNHPEIMEAMEEVEDEFDDLIEEMDAKLFK